MRFLLASSLVLLATITTPKCLAQEMALVNAPEPISAPGSAPTPETWSSSSSFAASAIMPVPIPRTVETKHSFALQDWTLLSAAAGLRFLDYKSTVKCMSDPANFREVELPQALVHNKPALGAFEASTVVANYYAYRLFVRRDHRNLARLGQYINIGAMAFTVGHNYYQLSEYWPRENLPLHAH
jgi:hypothetical protein